MGCGCYERGKKGSALADRNKTIALAKEWATMEDIPMVVYQTKNDDYNFVARALYFGKPEETFICMLYPGD